MEVVDRTLTTEGGMWLHSKAEDLYFKPGTKIYLGRLDRPTNYEEVSSEVALAAIAEKERQSTDFELQGEVPTNT